MPPSINVLWLSRADVVSLGVTMREGRRAAVLMGVAVHDALAGRLADGRALELRIGTWVEL